MARERERRRTAVRRGEIRTARRERQESKKKRRRILYLIGAGTFAVAIIVGLFLPSVLPGGGLGTGSGTSSYVDGIGVPQALMPSAFHVDPQTVAYSTAPPTSGDHWSATTQCGFYDGEVADEIVVHNMEHGNVIISHNLTEGVEQLREVHDNLSGNGEWLVTRFYPNIPEGTVALTAWGVLDEFEGIDEDRIERFYEAYKGNLFSDETRGLGRGIPCTSAARMDQ